MTETESKARKKKKNVVTEITSLVVTGIWLTALFTGQGWWLAALLIGYIVVVPLVAMMTGEEEQEEGEEYEAELYEGEDEEWSPQAREAIPRPKRDALEVLRDRYAHGELTEEQFERKVEVLLDTETLENAQEWVLDARSARTGEQQEQQVEEQEWSASQDKNRTVPGS